MRPAILVYNPTSGRQLAERRLPAILDELRRGGFEVEPQPTAGPGDATRLARAARALGKVEVVFAMGGDGTLREVAAGLAGGEVALGLLPAGTTNVLALALGLPREAVAAARMAARCTPRCFDVGRCAGEAFLMMASGGLDAAVVARQDAGLKRRFGRGAFVLEAAAQWWRYGYPELEIRTGGRTLHAGLFSASNIALYGGTFQMAPGASFCDGQLDLVAFRGRGRLPTLGFARDLAFGRHLGRGDVERFAVERVEIHGPGRLALQVDGDALSLEPPIEIHVEPGALQVLALPQA